jgi:hypothetical protein
MPLMTDRLEGRLNVLLDFSKILEFHFLLSCCRVTKKITRTYIFQLEIDVIISV